MTELHRWKNMIVIDPPAIPRSLARDRWAAVLVGAALSAAPTVMAAPDPAPQAPGPDAPKTPAAPDATGDAKTGVLKPPNVDADMSKPVPDIDPGIEKTPASKLGRNAKSIPETPSGQPR
jgi:hypothetical protein